MVKQMAILEKHIWELKGKLRTLSNWILPTTEVSMEADPSPPDFQIRPHLADVRNQEAEGPQKSWDGKCVCFSC